MWPAEGLLGTFAAPQAVIVAVAARKILFEFDLTSLEYNSR